MLAVWQAADDIDVFESGWTFDHFYPIFSDSTGPCLEGWTTLTALAQATKRLRLGTLVTGIHYRHPGGAGQHGCRARHHLRRPTGAGDRRRMERGGIRRLRHRAGQHQGTLRPVRGSVPGADQPAEQARPPTSTASTTSSKTPATSPRVRSARTRRSASAAAARNAPCASPRATPSTGTSPAGHRMCSRTSARCWHRTAPTSAATRKRSLTSAHLRLEPDLDYAKVIDDAAGAGRRGPRSGHRVHPAPHDPAVLEPLAEAIRDSGLCRTERPDSTVTA